jgi:UDP-glucose 4-epimerase
MNVLVLGGCGFVGSHLVDHLLVSGHKVRVFDCSREIFRAPLKKVDYIHANFNDKQMLSEALNGVDAVCHLISTTIPSTSNLNPSADVNENLVNTLHLLELMREKSLRRILFLSSGGTVYGETESPTVREEHPLNPISSYGIVKLTIEKYLNMYHRLYGLEPVIIRPANIYGSRQCHVGVQGLIGTIVSKLKLDDVSEIWGDGTVIRDFLHVKDLVLLCVMALESNSCGIFNAGSGQGHSINDVIRLISEIAGHDIKVKYSKSRSFDVQEIILNIERANHQLGWKPKISLFDGISNDYFSKDF